MEVAELAHVRRARDLLDREYARPFDVPVMARFREAYGETPYEHPMARASRRGDSAQALIRDSTGQGHVDHRREQFFLGSFWGSLAMVAVAADRKVID